MQATRLPPQLLLQHNRIDCVTADRQFAGPSEVAVWDAADLTG